MTFVPRARHKWSWWRRQWTDCQEPYSLGKGRTMQIKWQGRSEELNHPPGSDIPGFSMTPARGTGANPCGCLCCLCQHSDGKPAKSLVTLLKIMAHTTSCPAAHSLFSQFPVWKPDWETTVELLWIQLFLTLSFCKKHSSLLWFNIVWFLAGEGVIPWKDLGSFLSYHGLWGLSWNMRLLNPTSTKKIKKSSTGAKESAGHAQHLC